MWCRLRWVSPPDTGGFRVGATVNSIFEAILRRDRMLVAVALAVLVALCWAYLLAGAGMSMHEMDGMLMPMRMEPWTLHYAVIVFVMWSVMMAAMMLPSATPMLLLFARVQRNGGDRASGVATASFAAGYLLVWGAFSVAATALQWALQSLRWMSPMMQTSPVALGAALLVAAGVWQLTPWKARCLGHCRSPIGFLAGHWRAGRIGALRMGIVHGAYCLGCCWFLMALLFVGGVMNPFWIGALALYVLLEKLGPRGHLLSRTSGLLLVAAGIIVLAWVA